MELFGCEAEGVGGDNDFTLTEISREIYPPEVLGMPGKRIQIDDETWPILDLLARDRAATFQELMDEAISDLLKKYDRPTTLEAALRKSAKRSADVIPFKGRPRKKR